MYRIILLSLMLSGIGSLLSQDRTMTAETYDIWNTIENISITNNGDWVAYNIKPGKGDQTLVLYNTTRYEEKRFERAEDPKFDYNSGFVCFRIKPHSDSIRNLKKQGVKQDDLPGDTLGIFHLNDQVLEKIPMLESYSMPEKSGGVVAILARPGTMPEDSTMQRKESKENGSMLSILNIRRNTRLDLPFTVAYNWARDKNRLLVHTTGLDSTAHDHLYVVDATGPDTTLVWKADGSYHKYAISRNGNRVAITANFDTSELKDAYTELLLWEEGDSMAQSIAGSGSAFLDGWRISPYMTPVFSENGKRLFFGRSPVPLLGDTSLLEEEKAEVEIWNFMDGRLYTQQEIMADREKKRSWEVAYDLSSKNFTVLATENVPDTYISDEIKGRYTFSYNEVPYLKFISWLGYAFRDVYLTNLATGLHTPIASKVQGRPRLSPNENYIYWYNRPDTAWYAYDIKNDTLRTLSRGSFYDELNDRPMHPGSSGEMGWLRNDQYMLVYDHFDIWLVDPRATEEPVRITTGRENNFRYRYVELDEDTKSFPADTTLLLRFFDETDKSSGYAYLDLASFKITPLLGGPYQYSSRIYKAGNSRELVYTKENFETFPDLILSDTRFLGYRTISNVNPQQAEYGWGSIELYTWSDSTGKTREGLLVKPPGYIEGNQYPVIINFYERNAHRLHTHRAPYPGRSTICYSYYANKGYVIFNPDVEYEVGYPGQSAYEAVTSGARALIRDGIADPGRIGLQGHSWGGYQIADIITRTDMFRCAEAGAPVVNMISAYGGIRWRSGMSRMFQYERTQSRLGATLWERPDLYIENSPIFRIDKINTPVLILHNDKDGAVPWYQGIEFFVALRRLGKPAWLLNYNDEPHWPVKRPNRIDFNIRMEQFFDHYLMDAPMPEWMKDGVPAWDKGLKDGLEQAGDHIAPE